MMQTQRDNQLLEKLGAYGILSTRQVGALFFQDVDLTTVRKRLRILEDHDLIYRVQGLDDGGVGWVLTQKTATRLGIQFPIRHVNRGSLKHDVVLNDVRLSLERVGLGRAWVPEHVMKRQRLAGGGVRASQEAIIPDAIFTVQTGSESRVIALELELNGKNSRRYERILTKYQRMKNLWGLWYLVRSESLGKTLEFVWNRLNRTRNDLLIWSVLDEVLTDPANARVRSSHFSLPLKQIIAIPALTTALPQCNGKEAI